MQTSDPPTHGEGSTYNENASNAFAEELRMLVPKVRESVKLVEASLVAQGAHAASPANIPFLALVDIAYLHYVVSSTVMCEGCRGQYGLDANRGPVLEELQRADRLRAAFVITVLQHAADQDDALVWIPEAHASDYLRFLANTAESERLATIHLQPFFRILMDNYLGSLLMELAARLAHRYLDAPEFNVAEFGLPCVHQAVEFGPAGEGALCGNELELQFSLAQDLLVEFVHSIDDDDDDDDLGHLFPSSQLLH
jgi:hypothetical protein